MANTKTMKTNWAITLKSPRHQNHLKVPLSLLIQRISKRKGLWCQERVRIPRIDAVGLTLLAACSRVTQTLQAPQTSRAGSSWPRIPRAAAFGSELMLSGCLKAGTPMTSLWMRTLGTKKVVQVPETRLITSPVAPLPMGPTMSVTSWSWPRTWVDEFNSSSAHKTPCSLE